MAAYGEIDELNAVLGVVEAEIRDSRTRVLLHEIQRDLFALGARLADPRDRVAASRHKAAVTSSRVARLEQAIDARQERLPPLRAFILPGGSRAGSSLHLARTVCRRAERAVVALSRRDRVDPLILVYLNRLSDLLFVLARSENLRRKKPENRW